MRSLGLVASLSFLVAGCGGSSGGTADNNSDSGNNETQTGAVSVAITDAPVDEAMSVNIAVTEMRFVKSEGDEEAQDFVVDVEPAASVDLLSLQGSASAPIFSDVAVPVGEYEQVRLVLSSNPADNTIVTDEGTFELQTPSAARSGLKLNGGVTITPSGGDFTVDFDLRRSIVVQGNGNQRYLLKPVIQLVDNTNVGSLTGNVNIDACGSDKQTTIQDTAAVYLYEGADAAVEDYSGSTGPYSSALIQSVTGSELLYELGFIPSGSYTVTLVCNAVSDDTETSGDELVFSGTSTVTIEADSNAVNDFEAAENDDGNGGLLQPIQPF